MVGITILSSAQTLDKHCTIGRHQSIGVGSGQPDHIHVVCLLRVFDTSSETTISSTSMPKVLFC